MKEGIYIQKLVLLRGLPSVDGKHEFVCNKRKGKNGQPNASFTFPFSKRNKCCIT